MQLAANWPDKKTQECQVIASNQWGNPNVKSRAILSKRNIFSQLQRLNEARFQYGWVNKPSDSPILRETSEKLLLEKDFN